MNKSGDNRYSCHFNTVEGAWPGASLRVQDLKCGEGELYSEVH